MPGEETGLPVNSIAFSPVVKRTGNILQLFFGNMQTARRGFCW
jgi:hypothetical protein